MFFQPSWRPRIRRLLATALGWLVAAPVLGALTGPTLKFDYGAGQPAENPLGYFMYFVPLISPEHVASFTNAGNTQCARVVSCRCRTNGPAFHAVCEFTFLGDGMQSNVFDHAVILQRRQKDLKAGKPLAHQLTAICVQGSGRGSIEIDGWLTNGQPVVSEMRLRFNGHGHLSPVTVDLQDIVMRNGALHYENETVARVNALTFRQKSDPPKMEVTLGSVKRKAAGDGLWANFMGNLKGAAANLLLPPLTVTVNGNQTMLDFGLALAQQQPTFTFPFATRLTNGPALAL